MRLGIDEDRSSRGSLHVTTYLSDIAVVRRPGNSQRLTDLADSVAVILGKAAQLFDLLRRQPLRQPLGPAKQPATSPRSRQACVSALADEVSLELGEGAEDVEDELTATGRGIDLLLQGSEA